MTDKFIGSGIVFPIVLGPEGRPKIHNDVTLINASIMTILNWPEAHRFFNESFGCRIFELIEEPNDALVKTLIGHFVVDSLKKWEKRITVINDGVNIVGYDNRAVNIEIKYRINTIKLEETFIFPFYKEIIY